MLATAASSSLAASPASRSPAPTLVPQQLGEPSSYGTSQQTSLGADDDYWRLSSAFFRTAGTCLSKQPSQGWKPLPAGSTPRFLTIGTEGAGHHLLERMPLALCGGHGGAPDIDDPGIAAIRCGGQASLPFGREWRRMKTFEEDRDFRIVSRVRTLLARNDSEARDQRYIVLVRDPVAAKLSALARFSKHKLDFAALRNEASAMIRSFDYLLELVPQLPCARTLFLGYELLTSMPGRHKAAISTFLGVSGSKFGWLQNWFGDIKPCSRCGNMAATWEKIGSLKPEAMSECLAASNGTAEAVGGSGGGDGLLEIGRVMLLAPEEDRMQPPCTEPSECVEQLIDWLRMKLASRREALAAAGVVPSATAAVTHRCYRANRMRLDTPKRLAALRPAAPKGPAAAPMSS